MSDKDKLPPRRTERYEELPVNELAHRLRVAERALTFYGNLKNWGNDDWGCLAVIQGYEYGKPGTKARQALRRIRKP